MPTLNATKEVIRHCLPYVKGRILDLGAGEAKYKTILKSRGGEYVACDSRKGKSIDVVCDVADLPFEPESFDTVVSTQVFEHIKNPFAAAVEIKKVLKIGGYAIITAPFMIPFHPDPEDNFRFSESGLKELFEPLGFEIAESGIYGGFFTVVYEMIHFSIFNPYFSKSNRFAAAIGKIAGFLDRIFSSEKIYTNSFVVAKKK